LPNVGKSTLFNALTKQSAESANFPFTTIEPNVGVVPVPDERLEKLAEISQSAKITPTTIEFVDIAGLVKNAHQGEGLGNKFLSHIREVDAIAHVVRFFEDNDIQHVHNQIDPANDVETIKTELELADLATEESMKQKGTNTDHAIPKLSEKPVLYVANMDEEQIKHPDQILTDTFPPDKGGVRGVLPLSIKIEQELVELSAAERTTFLAEYGLKETRYEDISMQLIDIALPFAPLDDPIPYTSPSNKIISSSDSGSIIEMIAWVLGLIFNPSVVAGIEILAVFIIDLSTFIE